MVKFRVAGKLETAFAVAWAGHFIFLPCSRFRVYFLPSSAVEMGGGAQYPFNLYFRTFISSVLSATPYLVSLHSRLAVCNISSLISSFSTCSLRHIISYLFILNLQFATHHLLSLHSQLAVCDTSSLNSSFSTSCLQHLISYLFILN